MKRFCLFCLCLLCFSVAGTSAQVVEKVLDIFGADSLSNSKVAVTADSDSGRFGETGQSETAY